MNVRYLGAFADEQTMVATAPIVFVEICIDSQGTVHRQLGKVFHNGIVHAVSHEFCPYLLSHRKQAVQSGYGDSQVGEVFVLLLTIQYQALDFVLELLHQSIRIGNSDSRCREAVCRGPGGLRFLVVVVEEDARAGSVDDTLQRAEHDALLTAERGSIHVQRLDRRSRRKEEGHKSVVGPAQFVGFENAVARAGEIICRVGKCYLFHFAHVSTDDCAIGKLHEHRGRLLSHKL